jgi:cation diffusion facilitator CzcD-associated flavoprotein CzcO
MLDVPNISDIPGAERFRGRRFHSSRWDHSKSTAGERVASIGTGASAIQYVPAIAGQTAHLTVFQRTPIWISPRFDFPFTPEQQELFERDPRAAQKLRDEAFDAYESSSFDVDAAQTHEATELARRLSHPQGRRCRVARKADARLSARLQAAADVARLVPHLRVAARTTGNNPYRPSSPSTGCAPPTASNTKSTP